MGDAVIVGFLIMLVLTILVLRLLGAWMLRINEVISNQKIQIKQNDEIRDLLKEIKGKN